MLVHTPFPSQNRPCVGSDTHAGAATGSSWPAEMFEQVPRLVVRLHALQASVQAVSQQTPSTQLPDAQSVMLPQAWPLLLLHRWLALQAWLAWQVSSGVPG